MQAEGKWKKNTVLFLSSQILSLFGSALVQYAIMWHITLETQSGVMMTIAILCGFLPTLVLSPFAGVWADRYNRKALIILSDSLIAAATLGLAILFAAGRGAIGLMFAALVVRSFGAGIQGPAVGAFLPGIVPQDKLTKVNGLNGSIQSLVMLVSPMLSGALLSIAPIERIFFIDVVTAAAAIFILLAFLRVPPHAKALEKSKTSYFADMREGIRYIWNHGFIRVLFVYCAVYFFLVAPLAFLTPLQVTRTFGDDVWRLTAIEVTFSAGMTAGGFIIASWGGFRNRIHTMGLSYLVISVCAIAAGIVPSFGIYLALMVLAGIAMPVFNTPFTVLLQQKVEPDFMGRVFGVLTMISSSVMPLAMLFFGPVADRVRIEWLLIATGILMLVQSMMMIRNEKLLEAGKAADR